MMVQNNENRVFPYILIIMGLSFFFFLIFWYLVKDIIFSAIFSLCLFIGLLILYMWMEFKDDMQDPREYQSDEPTLRLKKRELEYDED